MTDAERIAFLEKRVEWIESRLYDMAQHPAFSVPPLPATPIKVPRPEGHDSWSIEIKTSGGGRGGGGGGKHPDTGETTSQTVADSP